MTSADPETARRLRRAATVCGGLLLIQVLVGIAVPAGLGWDFANFYDAGARLAAGQVDDLFDPTSPIAGAPPQGSMTFWSAPISAAFYAPLAALEPRTALVVFKVQNTVALFAAIAVLFAFYRRFAGSGADARRDFAARLAIGCLVFQPLWTVYRVGGQTTPTVLLLLCVALVCHVRARLALSSLCFVLALLVKPALATGLALLVLVSGWRFAGFTALFLSAAAAISLATLGWDVHAAFLAKLRGGAGAAYPWTFNSALTVPLSELRSYWAARGASGAAAALGGLAVAIRLGVVAGVSALLRASRREPWSGAARRHLDVTLALLFFLWISATVWEHYLSLLLPLLVFALAGRDALSAGARRLVVAVFALSAGQNLIVALFLRDHVVPHTAPALLAVGAFKSAPLWLAVALLARHWREIFALHAVDAWHGLEPDARPPRG